MLIPFRTHVNATNTQNNFTSDSTKQFKYDNESHTIRTKRPLNTSSADNDTKRVNFKFPPSHARLHNENSHTSNYLQYQKNK